MGRRRAILEAPMCFRTCLRRWIGQAEHYFGMLKYPVFLQESTFTFRRLSLSYSHTSSTSEDL